MVEDTFTLHPAFEPMPQELHNIRRANSFARKNIKGQEMMVVYDCDGVPFFTAFEQLPQFYGVQLILHQFRHATQKRSPSNEVW